jgi:hypothetical protein
LEVGYTPWAFRKLRRLWGQGLYCNWIFCTLLEQGLAQKGFSHGVLSFFERGFTAQVGFGLWWLGVKRLRYVGVAATAWSLARYYRLSHVVGFRYLRGLPVRGQRTRSNARSARTLSVGMLGRYLLQGCRMSLRGSGLRRGQMQVRIRARGRGGALLTQAGMLRRKVVKQPLSSRARAKLLKRRKRAKVSLWK